MEDSKMNELIDLVVENIRPQLKENPSECDAEIREAMRTFVSNGRTYRRRR